MNRGGVQNRRLSETSSCTNQRLRRDIWLSMAHRGRPHRRMKRGANGRIVVASVTGGRGPSGAYAACQCGPDALALQLDCALAQRIVAFRGEAEEYGKESQLFSSVLRSRRKEYKMTLMYRRCAGLEVHKSSVSVAVRIRVAARQDRDQNSYVRNLHAATGTTGCLAEAASGATRGYVKQRYNSGGFQAVNFFGLKAHGRTCLCEFDDAEGCQRFRCEDRGWFW